MRVLIQLRPERELIAAVTAATAAPTPGEVAAQVPGVELDPGFSPVLLPRPTPAAATADPLSLTQPLTFSARPEDASVLVRGEISDKDLSSRVPMLLSSRPDVVGVFSDPVIEQCPMCPGDAAVGDWHDAARMIGVDDLQTEGADGSGVTLAIVDSGINTAHLSQRLGRNITVDVANSWTPSGAPTQPGTHPVHHGTMCAFDALIAGPNVTLVDVALLLSRRPGQTQWEGFLSDAVAAYAHLRQVLDSMPASDRSLVVSNSWGMFSPRWDFPPGHPGNYSDNLAHPFNIIVSSLEAADADILFAAGNCGRECPDGRCEFGATLPICGANSHSQVLSIAGVDIRGDRVGYSSQGPGRLASRKPDISAPTHFAGSGAFGDNEPDDGTSAACPVAAGVVAAARTVLGSSVSPRQLRTLIRRTAADRSAVGFDDGYGYGVIDGAAIAQALSRRLVAA